MVNATKGGETAARFMQHARCPDDGGLLRAGERSLRCTHCGREFHRLGERVFELKSAAPKPVNSSVQSGYAALHAEALTLEAQPPGWGDLAGAPPGKRAFVRRERQAIAELLADRGAGVVVDVSGGVGNYSSYLAAAARTVIHCELHVPSFAQACRDHGEIDNMVFVRGDYLALPLADASADGVICTDTLIRGVEHERALLAEIRRILKPGGRAVVDFHHHRFRRIQKRSPLAKPYLRAEFERLTVQAGFRVERTQGIGYIPARAVPWEWSYRVFDSLARLMVPPSRYLVVLAREE